MADRYDRRIVVRICQGVEGCAAAFLALGTFEGWLGTTAIFGAVAVIGAARCFESPTVSALLPGVVAPEALPAALALSASAMQSATIIGPALGGACILPVPAGPMR